MSFLFPVDDFFPLLEKIRGSIDDGERKEIKRHVGNVKKNVENAESAVDHLASKIPSAKINDKDTNKPDFEAYIELVKFIEEYRWLGTVCFYTWTALVGLLLIGGTGYFMLRCIAEGRSMDVITEL